MRARPRGRSGLAHADLRLASVTDAPSKTLFVQVDDDVSGLERRMIVQGVADRIAVDFGEPFEPGAHVCRMVIIGFGLEREAICAGLEAAAR